MVLQTTSDWSSQLVTAKCNGNLNRKQWIKDIQQWTKDNKIIAVWQGESTFNGDTSYHLSHWKIYNEQARTLFLLRWS